MIQPSVSLLIVTYIARKYKQNELPNIFLLDIHESSELFFTQSSMHTFST